jgi:hypothetical protein
MPVTVGPNDRLKPAMEAATPLMEPSTVDDGAAFARRIAHEGNAITWRVIFPNRAAYTAGIWSLDDGRAGLVLTLRINLRHRGGCRIRCLFPFLSDCFVFFLFFSFP